jgi:hypothetical protein
MQPQKLKLSQTQSLVLRLLHDRTVEGPLAFGRSPKPRTGRHNGGLVQRV